MLFLGGSYIMISSFDKQALLSFPLISYYY